MFITDVEQPLVNEDSININFDGVVMQLTGVKEVKLIALGGGEVKIVIHFTVAQTTRYSDTRIEIFTSYYKIKRGKRVKYSEEGFTNGME